jgi:DNA repair protein RadC
LSVLFQGTIDGCSVHSRVVVEAALRHRTAAVIFVHNHPSGDPTPSQADRRITETLRQALDLLDIRVLDHIVVAREGSVSLAARGLL